MAEKGIVVKVHFGVERQGAAVARRDEGIDLDQRSVRGLKGAIEVLKETHRLVHHLALKPQAKGQLARLEGLESDAGIDEFLQDFFRMLGGHHFNFHAAFAGGHEHGPAGGAVDDNAEVKFARDVQAFLNQHALDQAALRPRLVSDQGHAQDSARQGLSFRRVVSQFYAATFTAATGVNLGFDHHRAAAQFFRHSASFLGLGNHLAARHGDSELCKNLFRLIFVDFHIESC